MLVVLLIGIIVAIVVPNIFSSDEDRVRHQMRMIEKTISLAMQESRITGIPLQARFFTNRIEFRQLNEDQTWKVLNEKPFSSVSSIGNLTVSSFSPALASNLVANDESESDLMGISVFPPDGLVQASDVVFYDETLGHTTLHIRPGFSGAEMVYE